MPSTYSTNFRFELIGSGEQQGTWGTTTNTNLGTLIEQAIGGYEVVAVSDAGDTTLTTNNGSSDQSRNMVLNLTGTLTAARNVICPTAKKLYVVRNATTGGFAVTFKVNGQTGISIPNGSTYFLYVDGTDARLATGTIASQNANSVSITGGTISGATVSNSSLSNVSIVANASSLGVRDSDGSHVLSVAAGSNLTANRVLTLTTGDVDRTLDISASNVTVTVAGAALIDDANAAAQRTTLGLGTAATLDVGTSANNVVQLDGTAKLPAVDGSNLTGITTIPAGSLMPYAGSSTPSGWLLCAGQAVSRTTYAALFAAISTTYGTGDGSTTFNLPDLRGRVVAGKDDMNGTDAARLSVTLSGTTTAGSAVVTGLSNTSSLSVGMQAVGTNIPSGRTIASIDSATQVTLSSGTSVTAGTANIRFSFVDGPTLGATGGDDINTLTIAQMPAHQHFVANTGSGTGSLTTTNYVVQYSDTGARSSYDLAGSATVASIGLSSSTGGGQAHNNIQPTIILNYIIKT